MDVQEAAICSIEEKYNDAWNRHDADGMVESLVDEGQFVTVNGVWLHTRAQLRQLLQRLHSEGGPFQKSTRETLHVEVRFLSDDVAIVHSLFKVANDLVEEEGFVAREGVGIRVVANKQGEWRTIAVQNTDVRNRRD